MQDRQEKDGIEWRTIKLEQLGSQAEGKIFADISGETVLELYTKPHNLVFTNKKGVSIIIQHDVCTSTYITKF